MDRNELILELFNSLKDRIHTTPRCLWDAIVDEVDWLLSEVDEDEFLESSECRAAVWKAAHDIIDGVVCPDHS